MHRLTYSLLAVVLLAIIGIGWSLDLLSEKMLHQAPDNITMEEVMVERLAVALNANDDPVALLEKDFSAQGYELSLTDVADFPLPAELKSRFSMTTPLILESDSGVSFHIKLASHNLILSVSPPQVVTDGRAENLKLVFTLLFYTGILLLLLIWLYPLVSRLHKLKITAKKFGEGHLEQRIATTKLSYIGEIETEFNKMARKIQGLVDDNKLLSSAVSHDLRTPLARLRFGIDALTEVEDAEKRKLYEKRISRDLDEMESLVETLLSYARMEQSLQSLAMKPFHFDELVEEVVETYAAHDKAVDFRKPNKPCTITGEKRYLRMLVTNVLQNAVRYASESVLVSVELQQNTVVFRVQDDGVGIDPEKREEVVKPFVKGSSFDKSGYGMGLAIVARIAQWHEASLEISSSDELGGAEVKVVLLAQA